MYHRILSSACLPYLNYREDVMHKMCFFIYKVKCYASLTKLLSTLGLHEKMTDIKYYNNFYHSCVQFLFLNCTRVLY